MALLGRPCILYVDERSDPTGIKQAYQECYSARKSQLPARRYRGAFGVKRFLSRKARNVNILF